MTSNQVTDPDDFSELIDSLKYRPVATTAAQMRTAAVTLEAQRNTIVALRAELQQWKSGSATVNDRLLAEIERQAAEISRLRAEGERLRHLCVWGTTEPVGPLYDENKRLSAENLALHEQVAALESREVCTAAHENVGECGYCQRDRLRSALVEIQQNDPNPHARYLAAKALAPEPKIQRCAALNSADPPQDCDAPFCGCNPEWTKCIEWLRECGWTSPDEPGDKPALSHQTAGN